jgi:hypothetical protein
MKMEGTAIILAILGGISLAVGAVWMIGTAWRESSEQGLLCWFVPFYPIYYGITRWRKSKQSFIVGIVGFTMLAIGFLIFFLQFNSEVTSVISQFMEAAEAKNVEQAYSSFHPEGISKGELAAFIEREPELFRGYERVITGSWNVNYDSVDTIGYVSGYIMYTGDKSLPFEASLTEENNAWKVLAISIGDKTSPYRESTPAVIRAEPNTTAPRTPVKTVIVYTTPT